MVAELPAEQWTVTLTVCGVTAAAHTPSYKLIPGGELTWVAANLCLKCSLLIELAGKTDLIMLSYEWVSD